MAKDRRPGIAKYSDNDVRFDEIYRLLGDQEQLLITVVEVGRLLSLSRAKIYELLYAGQRMF